MKRILQKLVLLTVLLAVGLYSKAQGTKALTVDDMMKFRQIESPVLSPDGKWVVLTARPDRGDPEVQVCSSDGETLHRLKRAEKPVLSDDGNWVAAVQTVAALESLNAEKGKAPLPGMFLLNTRSGEKETRDSILSFTFSNNSEFLVFHRAEKSRDKDKPDQKKIGSSLTLRSLEDGKEYFFPFVSAYAMDSVSHHLAMVITDSSGLGNGVHLADLKHPSEDPIIIYQDSSAWAANLTWNNLTGQLVFLAGLSGEKNRKSDADLHLWWPGTSFSQVILEDADLDEGWKVYHTNKLTWSLDGSRLFLGIKPESEIISPKEEKDTAVNLYNPEEILADRGVDVWHWNDPLINPQQKKQWKREKDRTYMGVYHLEEKRFVQLADQEMPGLSFSDNKIRLLAHSNVPYAKEQTWDGRYQDYYLVDLQTGERNLILKHHGQTVRLSPDGQQLVYYKNKQWYMMETSTLETRNLTQGLDVPFEDEDWDYPEAVPGYGLGGWLDQSSAALIYDKYDIWLFPSDGEKAVCLTRGEGRKEKYQFRIKILDKKKKYLESGEDVFLSAYHDVKKHTALYKMKAGEEGMQMIFDEKKKYTLIGKARDEDAVIYTRQSYTEFPDLWLSDVKFKKTLRLTDVNPQVADFAWGSARLVDWHSVDGTPLQGILILPDNADPGKKYPVLVYYYRFFTNRLYDFNHVAVNHRPCFPFYASNGYAVFLPDIRFDIGTLGYSATKCLVPGVQKIIDMGVADPKAICLHGHSWSGYQTAFAITQTDIFTCAIAGAPVSNMTSAYSGIRWESGMARQFQYEKSQSRIGGSLWEARDKYIENSPVFFADRISTPLLIQFGDLDGAVPWYQGIELYLAMRRLDKDCIFLQYRDEGHHLKQYANKLDYTLKFKEYLDHYLKGEPAAEWIKAGVPYQGQ
jgi:dipeptidyl aminopeptidase/acylaminoacyl peptidase